MARAYTSPWGTPSALFSFTTSGLPARPGPIHLPYRGSLSTYFVPAPGPQAWCPGAGGDTSLVCALRGFRPEKGSKAVCWGLTALQRSRDPPGQQPLASQLPLSLLYHTHTPLSSLGCSTENPGEAGGLDALYSHTAEIMSSERASNLPTQHSRWGTKPGQ